VADSLHAVAEVWHDVLALNAVAPPGGKNWRSGYRAVHKSRGG